MLRLGAAQSYTLVVIPNMLDISQSRAVHQIACNKYDAISSRCKRDVISSQVKKFIIRSLEKEVMKLYIYHRHFLQHKSTFSASSAVPIRRVSQTEDTL